jgi:hypothetical protein
MIDLNSLSSSEIVGLTIIGEARGQLIQGQVGVGSVIRNRVNLRKKTYHEICLEPFQFSCWNQNDPNYPLLTDLAEVLINGQFINDPYLKQCLYVASGIVENVILDNTNGAINYLSYSLFFSSRIPSWARNAKNLKTIGDHIFFNA